MDTMDNTITERTSDDLVYTDLLPCSIQCAQESLSQDIHCSGHTTSNEAQLLRYFLDTNTHTNDDINEVRCPIISEDSNSHISQFILQRIEDECNSLPRDSFISQLSEMCNHDIDSLEHVRLQYFLTAKMSSNFPYPQAVLKKRVQPKTKKGETLLSKLCRDCYVLRLASKGEFSDDLKETLNINICKKQFMY